ncbi:MAG: YdcF family protein [Bacteroidia bacterium]|nr:YdcF family protein [Bacteroidia bacterium]MDW8015449.1 YdcF family protein [Bacteroidia bacterium]
MLSRKGLWFLLFLLGIGVGGAGYAFRYRLLSWMGERLLVRTPPPPPPWDAIIVLSGRPFERSLKAAELYHYSPTWVVALGGAHNDDLLALGMPYTQECTFTATALENFCVPPSHIHRECVGTSTQEEIAHIRHLCQLKGWKKIVIVSSPFHGRRIELLAQRWLAPDSITWGIASAQPLSYSIERWWASEGGILTVFQEYVKGLYYIYKGYF